MTVSDCGTVTITRTWTPTDKCGNVGESQTQIITIVDTTAPAITTPSTATVTCAGDEANILPPPVTDACDPNPVWAQSDVISAQNCANQYTVTRTWTSTDKCGNSASVEQTIIVQDNTAPSMVAPADITLECGDNVLPSAESPSTAPGYPTSVSDNCAGSPTVTFTDETATDSCGEVTITRTWTVTDVCGNTVSATQVVTVHDTTAPSWRTLTLPAASVTIECPQDPTDLTVTGAAPQATDICDPAPVVAFTDDTTEEGCGSTKVIVRTWTATDKCGNVQSYQQTITVVDHTAPLLVNKPRVNPTPECVPNVNISVAAMGQPSATDACDGAVATSLNEVTSQSTCGLPVVTRTWTAKDACNNAAIPFTQTIEVIDTKKPVLINTPSNKVLECVPDLDTSVQTLGFPVASDVCQGTFDADLQEADAVSSCGLPVITRTWTAVDNCGNEADSYTQTVTVRDTQKPVLIDLPAASVVLECTPTTDTSVAANGEPVSTDVCDDTVTADLSENTVLSSCGLPTITRTWSSVDKCGNVADPFTQVITVQDTQKPVLINKPEPALTLECSFTLDTSTAALGAPSAEDVCPGSPSVSLSENTVLSSCGLPTITRTWSSVDKCGNVADPFTQVSTVVDTTPPTFVSEPASITVECVYNQDLSSANPVIGAATGADTCDHSPVVSQSDVVATSACGLQTITRTWSITDKCGNVVTTPYVQTIAQQDTLPPVPSNIIEPLCIVEWDGPTTDYSTDVCGDVPSASDQCDPAPAHVSSDDKIPSDICEQTFLVIRTWVSTDACGNSVSQSQNITVEDTTPPTLSLPADITIDCVEATQELCGTATATDKGGAIPDVFLAYDDWVPNINGLSSDAHIVGWIYRHWHAVDPCGNLATAIQTITVRDTTPPMVTPQEGLCLWPPNGKYFCWANVLSTGNFLSASDNCDAQYDTPWRSVTRSFVECTYSENDGPVKNGDDGTCLYNPSSDSLCVESRRSGNTVRTYNVVLSVADAHGNSQTSTTEVVVNKSSKDGANVTCRSPNYKNPMRRLLSTDDLVFEEESEVVVEQEDANEWRWW